MKLIIRKIFAVLAILLLAACAHQPEVERDVTWHAESDVRGAMQDVMININRHRDGSLHTVMVEGVGAGNRQSIEWSIRWFDHSGRQVRGISDRYRRATINPGIPFQLEAVAPVDNAARARIHVRRSTTS